ITGTATDAGGGVVSAVEVSADGGTTWHPAIGTTNWTYSWAVPQAGSATIRSRAADDSGNLETPGPGNTITVAMRSCPCSIWPPSAAPGNPSTADSSRVEVGVQFRADLDGTITGIRFYKGSTNTGTHVGSLWSTSGTLLGRVTFSSETASGWQQAN